MESLELKIKSKHLGLEAQVIRFEERKLKKTIEWLKDRQISPVAKLAKWESINAHRRWDVRNENRATFLARAFINGTPYRKVERKIKDENKYNFRFYILPRVAAMVAKYDPKFANLCVPNEDGKKSYPDRETHRIAVQKIIEKWTEVP